MLTHPEQGEELPIKEKFCETIASNEREYNDCMRNPSKFITIKTVKFIGNTMLNIGVKGLIEYLPTVV